MLYLYCQYSKAMLADAVSCLNAPESPIVRLGM
jgi:hypothetical protein